jgi:hypothetical protein
LSPLQKGGITDEQLRYQFYIYQLQAVGRRYTQLPEVFGLQNIQNRYPARHLSFQG